MGIYVASRTKHADMWRQRRAGGVAISCTWIDEAGAEETASFTELWARIKQEIFASRALVLYAEPADLPMKGALVEVGMALMVGRPVYCALPGVDLVGRTLSPIGSWLHALEVMQCGTLEEALERAHDV